MDANDTTYGYRGSEWIKRIVVAADGSPASSRGLEQVADLAPELELRLWWSTFGIFPRQQ